MSLLRHRGGRLHWTSEETGALGATGTTFQFGINRLGLITVFAKDICDLAHWEQRIWSAHNVTPEGGVSRELFAAQMDVMPAHTKAPEGLLPGALERIDAAFEARYGSKLLRANDAVGNLMRRAHRFLAVEDGGLLELAKELTRLFVERIQVDAVLAHVTLAKGEKKPGSLKALERLLATLVAPDDARTMMSALFGIYDLRVADAHIGSSLIDSGKERAGVDGTAPAPMQGRQLLQSFIDGLDKISDTLSET